MIEATPATPPPPEEDRSDRLARIAVIVALVAAGLVTFVVMAPERIFQANTPTGGDMGAHVLIPAYVRDHLISSGRIMGWSNDWYAGFPVLYFYFPLPALTIVVLDFLLPYGVAFKLVTVAGLVALPFSSYYLARCMGFSRPVATVGGVAGGTFVFMESFTIFGGNTLSTLAGEYSFSWSFALAMAYLGMTIRNVRTGRGFSLGPGVLLALTALSHIITTAVIVIASLPLLFKRKGVQTVVGSWGVGFALAGFWAIPLLARVQGFTTDMGWHPVRGFDNVLPRDMWAIGILALAGLVWAASRRMIIGPALTLIIMPIAGFYVIEYIDFTPLYNARLLPFWYYIGYLFAGLAVGTAIVAMVRRFRQEPAYLWTGVLVASAFFLVVGAIGIAKARAWANWNYAGYEGKQTYAYGQDGSEILQTDHWADYSNLMAVLDELPPGRVMWEANSELNRYGTPMALMLTGYWSEGHPSMEGLLFESSLTTPFHFLNAAEVSERPSNPVGGLDYHRLDFDRAVKHLAVYDVAYYVSFTERATEEADAYGLERLAVTDPFVVYALPESSLVDVATYEPVVWDGDEEFLEAALDWYDDVGGLDRWIVADGPEEWPRVDQVPFDPTTRLTAGTVSNVVLENHRISFSTTAVGVPHLVKVSHFPNWQTDDALGPWRAAPSLMVVVPTQEDVVIEFKNTWAETLGWTLTLGSLGAMLVLAGVRAYRRRSGVARVDDAPGSAVS